MSGNPLRNLPSVHELLESPPLQRLRERVGRNVLVHEVRSFLDHVRDEVMSRAEDFSNMRLPAAGELAERLAQWIRRDQRPRLRPVINATGILLHTGLGRAPLSKEALDEITSIAQGYCTLEVDPVTGDRSRRVQAVERLLCQTTGAEAALVVNNNAAATLLALSALCTGRDVLVSRGQLIEIGGSYRLPDIMQASGARLCEVGTTNRTRCSDYQHAITDRTGALMRVHTSNYVIQGFTEETSLEELVELAKQHQLPVIDDIGSGALIDFSRYGLTGEPNATESLQRGADLVLFSGDKLLGGPQAGIVLGRRQWLQQLEGHPLARALRVDKLTLAALAGTLRAYVKPDEMEEKIPLLAMLSTNPDNLRHRAERICSQISGAASIERVEVAEGTTYLGGGSVPTQQLTTRCLVISPRQGCEQFSRQLRLATPAIFARVHQDHVWLDLRSVLPDQDRFIVDVITSLRVATGDQEPSSEVVREPGGENQPVPRKT